MCCLVQTAHADMTKAACVKTQVVCTGPQNCGKRKKKPKEMKTSFMESSTGGKTTLYGRSVAQFANIHGGKLRGFSHATVQIELDSPNVWVATQTQQSSSIIADALVQFNNIPHKHYLSKYYAEQSPRGYVKWLLCQMVTRSVSTGTMRENDIVYLYSHHRPTTRKDSNIDDQETLNAYYKKMGFIQVTQSLFAVGVADLLRYCSLQTITF